MASSLSQVLSPTVGVESAFPLLELEAISVFEKSRVLLEDVSLQIFRGQIVTVVGPNGAGKTTLLRAILGLQAYQRGAIRRKPGLVLGYVPQQMQTNSLIPLTVRDFFALQVPTDSLDQRLLAVNEWVHGYGCSVQLLARDWSGLSGGERQKVLLTAALLQRPDLLILDEPTQGVDVGGQAQFYEILARLSKQHALAVLMVSHDLHIVMANSHQIICLNRHICCRGYPQQVSEHPDFRHLFGWYQHHHAPGHEH